MAMAIDEKLKTIDLSMLPGMAADVVSFALSSARSAADQIKQFVEELLQPLLENVIKHSVEKSVDEIKAELKVVYDGKTFELILSNDIPFISSDPQQILLGNGIGLTNLEERLVLNYGKNVVFNYGFEKQSFVVHLKIEDSTE